MGVGKLIPEETAARLKIGEKGNFKQRDRPCEEGPDSEKSFLFLDQKEGRPALLGMLSV